MRLLAHVLATCHSTRRVPHQVGLYSDTTKDARLQWRPGRQPRQLGGVEHVAWRLCDLAAVARGEYHNAVLTRSSKLSVSAEGLDGIPDDLRDHLNLSFS